MRRRGYEGVRHDAKADGPGGDCSPTRSAAAGSVCLSAPAAAAKSTAGLHTNTHTHTPKQLLEFVIKKIVFLLGKFYNIGRLMLWAR